MENKINSSTKDLIKNVSPVIPKSHPSSMRCEQNIIQKDDNTIVVNNYYMTMTDKQYIHFFKGMCKKLMDISEYQICNKSIKQMVIDKGLELAFKEFGDPFKSLTVAEVAKDLKMGENLTNQLFKRPDFPSVNIGKTKTVSALAYMVWKMEHKESEVNVNE